MLTERTPCFSRCSRLHRRPRVVRHRLPVRPRPPSQLALASPLACARWTLEPRPDPRSPQRFPARLSLPPLNSKSIGLPQSHSQGGLVGYLQKALMDENVQYAVLSLYWWISKPIACASSLAPASLQTVAQAASQLPGRSTKRLAS